MSDETGNAGNGGNDGVRAPLGGALPGDSNAASSPPASVDAGVELASATALRVFRERTTIVSEALAELSEVAVRVGAKSLNERIRRDLVNKLGEDRFHLVVVGEFNHGKSSFVNALLGEQALPVGVTPTTAAIHHLKYAEAPEATVVFSSGKRDRIPFGDVRGFAVGGGKSADEVDFVEVGYPAPLLKERILLVDTPGVNDLSLQRADITYSYIPRADAVLFLLDAGQILKESERVFLQEKLLKASRDKIVFVITKWDILDASERSEALAYAKDQLAKLVKNPVIFPISAESALHGHPEESGMPELIGHLTRFLAEERGRILLDNALGEGLNVSLLLQKGVDARVRALAMKSDELERRIARLAEDLAGQAGTIEQRRSQIREDVTGIKVGVKKDLERFVEDVIRQLPQALDNAKAGDLKQYFPAFLEKTFRDWAEKETKEIATALEALAEKTIALVKEDAHAATRRLSETMGAADVKNLEVKVDTFKYDVGIFALFTVGAGVLFANVMLGGILLLAAPLLALALRDRIEGEYKKRALEVAPEVLRRTAEKVGPKLDEMIDDFAAKLDAWVVTAGEELHREILEVLRAAQTARAESGNDEAQARAEIAGHAEQLTRATKKLEELRTALWGARATSAAAAPPAPGAPAPGPIRVAAPN